MYDNTTTMVVIVLHMQSKIEFIETNLRKNGCFAYPYALHYTFRARKESFLLLYY